MQTNKRSDSHVFFCVSSAARLRFGTGISGHVKRTLIVLLSLVALWLVSPSLTRDGAGARRRATFNTCFMRTHVYIGGTLGGAR